MSRSCRKAWYHWWVLILQGNVLCSLLFQRQDSLCSYLISFFHFSPFWHFAHFSFLLWFLTPVFHLSVLQNSPFPVCTVLQFYVFYILYMHIVNVSWEIHVYLYCLWTLIVRCNCIFLDWDMHSTELTLVTTRKSCWKPLAEEWVVLASPLSMARHPGILCSCGFETFPILWPSEP